MRKIDRALPLFFLLLVIAVTGLIRLRLLGMPLERDEGEYAYIAQQMLRGIPPYISAYSMKFPGIYLIYAVFISLFGHTIEGIHTGLILVNAADIVLMFLLARRLIGSYGGIIAAAFYALSSLDPNFFGLSANAEHFVVLPVLGGLLLLLKALESEKGRLFLLSGLFFGITIIIKQHGIFFGIFGLLYLFWYGKNIRKTGYPDIAKKSALFMAGVALPFIITCLVFYLAGAFNKFWFWTVIYGARYINCVSLQNGLKLLSSQLANILLSPSAGICFMGIMGLFLLFILPKKRYATVFIPGFFAASIFSLAQGLYFRSHYFIFMLPALSILAGVTVEAIRGVISERSRVLSVRPALIPGFLALAVFSCFVLGNSGIFFFKSQAEVCVDMYGINPFKESVIIAEHIRKTLDKNDNVAVFGSEPQIYFYLNRPSPTKYVYMYPLFENHSLYLSMQEEMLGEVVSARPRYIIFVRIKASWTHWSGFNGMEKYLLDGIFKFIAGHYELNGIVDIVSREKTIYKWADEVKGYSPVSKYNILVYKRKSD